MEREIEIQRDHLPYEQRIRTDTKKCQIVKGIQRNVNDNDDKNPFLLNEEDSKISEKEKKEKWNSVSEEYWKDMNKDITVKDAASRQLKSRGR